MRNGTIGQKFTDEGATMSHKKISRNAPCPCGSGKKYKKCCYGKEFDYEEDDQGNVFKSIPMSEDSNGFRVLAVAFRDLEPKAAYSKDDERDLVLRGYVAFLDPPKDTSRAAIA